MVCIQIAMLIGEYCNQNPVNMSTFFEFFSKYFIIFVNSRVFWQLVNRVFLESIVISEPFNYYLISRI